MQIGIKELTTLVELEKKAIELELKKTYLELENQKEAAEEAANSLDKTKSTRDEIHGKLGKAEMRFAFLKAARISDLQSKLSNFSLEEQAKSLKERKGEVFEILRERSQFLKDNIENRENLAKLLIVLSTVKDPETRDRLLTVLEDGKVSESVPVGGCDKETINVVVILLNRLGVACSFSEDSNHVLQGKGEIGEKLFVISNRKVWVAPHLVEKLDDNLSKIEEVSPKLQWKNAQKQIKTLSDEEENEFMDLQRKYLDLLKEQDEILKEANDEDRFVIEVS